MSQIKISNVTFCYEGSFDPVFENVSFSIDSNWKLGLIGRNGRGKTTFLNLLLGKYGYEGNIVSDLCFDYFPYTISEVDKKKNSIEICEKIMHNFELWKVCRELDLLKVDAEILYREFQSLSYGEQTKLMLALLFSREGGFLLIDEPTNHLDMLARDTVEAYLSKKKGYILVSHDRNLLDACIDHVLVINKNNIEIQKGNFSSWWGNKEKQDQFERVENEKYKKAIGKLKEAAERTAQWADAVERTKIGYDPIKDTNRNVGTRAYLGEKSKRMQQRRKNLENRQESAIVEKGKLLKNIETKIELKIMQEEHHKEQYLCAENLSLYYGEKEVFKNLSFLVKRGECVAIKGGNGSGKSTLVKTILNHENTIWMNRIGTEKIPESLRVEGKLEIPKGLKISYINQDTSHLKGSLEGYISELGVEESLFKTILRQLDFERVQFEKKMEEYSEGQKKKVLIASSLLQKAHLYIWDEPLNYIDVFSRIQLEELILTYQLTMLFIEHDKQFVEHISDRKILL